MDHKRKKWQLALRKHEMKCRLSRQIPAPEDLSHQQLFQYQAIRKSVISFTERALQAKPAGLNTQPNSTLPMAFTSDSSGLAAAEAVRREQGSPLILLYPDELGLFLQLHPDRNNMYHAHIWSHFLSEPDTGIMAASRYPLKEREKYLLHIEGSMQGPMLSRGAEHLWAWDGISARLLRKNYRQWAA